MDSDYPFGIFKIFLNICNFLSQISTLNNSPGEVIRVYLLLGVIKMIPLARAVQRREVNFFFISFSLSFTFPCLKPLLMNIIPVEV